MLTNYLERKFNKKCFPLICGGTNKIGVWGYIDMIDRELSHQIENLENTKITDIVVPTASGGTAFGIAIGTYLNKYFNNIIDPQTKKRGPRIHAMLTMGEKMDYYYQQGNKILKDIKFENKYGKLNDTLNIMYHEATGIGYSKNTPNELSFFVKLAQKNGILLDPTYNGKSLYYFIKGINDKSIKTQGKNIIFLHTGGLFAYFDENKIKYIEKCVPIYRQRKFDFVSKL